MTLRYEVLNCMVAHSDEKINFLERMTGFLSSHFLLQNMQELSSEQQELILNFISSSEASAQCNFNFVQVSAPPFMSLHGLIVKCGKMKE